MVRAAGKKSTVEIRKQGTKQKLGSKHGDPSVNRYICILHIYIYTYVYNDGSWASKHGWGNAIPTKSFQLELVGEVLTFEDRVFPGMVSQISPWSYFICPCLSHISDDTFPITFTLVDWHLCAHHVCIHRKCLRARTHVDIHVLREGTIAEMSFQPWSYGWCGQPGGAALAARLPLPLARDLLGAAQPDADRPAQPALRWRGRCAGRFPGDHQREPGSLHVC